MEPICRHHTLNNLQHLHCVCVCVSRSPLASIRSSLPKPNYNIAHLKISQRTIKEMLIGYLLTNSSQKVCLLSFPCVSKRVGRNVHSDHNLSQVHSRFLSPPFLKRFTIEVLSSIELKWVDFWAAAIASVNIGHSIHSENDCSCINSIYSDYVVIKHTLEC